MIGRIDAVTIVGALLLTTFWYNESYVHAKATMTEHAQLVNDERKRILDQHVLSSYVH